jgi:hypothetical protein
MPFLRLLMVKLTATKDQWFLTMCKADPDLDARALASKATHCATWKNQSGRKNHSWLFSAVRLFPLLYRVKYSWNLVWACIFNQDQLLFTCQLEHPMSKANLYVLDPPIADAIGACSTVIVLLHDRLHSPIRGSSHAISSSVLNAAVVSRLESLPW